MSTGFFIQKATDFITNIEEIENNFIEYEFFLTSKSSSWKGNNEYEKQQEEISELKFKVKLMLSEFKEGHLFTKRIEEEDKKILFASLRDKSNLPFYRKLLILFIQHLKTYHSDTLAA